MVTSPDGILPPRSLRGIDVREWERGVALDQKAEGIIRDKVPSRTMEDLTHLVASVGNPTTRGPLRRALWLLSRGRIPKIWETPIPEANAVYNQSDAIYWEFSLRHHRLLLKLAGIHARKSMIAPEEVMSAVQEAPYRAAILWDPTRGAYTTALTWQVRALWQRAPERQSAVSLPTHRMIGAELRGFGKVCCLSLDVPRNDRLEEGELWVDTLAEEAKEPLHSNTDVDRINTIVDFLPDRYRIALRGRAEGLTLREVGNLLGVSRERARQIHEVAMSEVRDVLRIPTSPSVPPTSGPLLGTGEPG